VFLAMHWLLCRATSAPLHDGSSSANIPLFLAGNSRFLSLKRARVPRALLNFLGGFPVAIDASKEDLLIGVCGAGAMGRGIVQVAAAGGVNVRVFDINKGQLQDAVNFIDNMLGRAVEKGRMEADAHKVAINRIEMIDSMEGFRECDIVIEAATENLDIKKKIFEEIEKNVSDETIIATNTSSLSVTTIASACEKPERIAGFHFFNPVPLMRLVEVIDGVLTLPEVGDQLMVLGARMTREPVRLKDAPGFLVNQVGRGYNVETQHLQAECVGEFADLDRILRDGAGFRMGPFELMDLTGLDVTHPASELIYRQFFDEPRYRPSTVMQSRMEAGILGRKTGRGYYRYEDGKKVEPDAKPAPEYDGRSVWISKAEPDGHTALSEIVDKCGGQIDNGDTPGPVSLILVTPVGQEVTQAAIEQGLDATRTLGVDYLIGLSTHRTVVTNPATKSEYRDSAHGLLTADDVGATVVRDCPAFVCQRVLSTICNIGCQIAQLGTAEPDDIDKAVVLGLNYPSGPLTFGETLGPKIVLRILEGLYASYGDPRYRPSPWLRRRALLGLSLFDTEI
jgi:3-hydroxybutyryl-CoA dehydrogenase